VSNGSGNSLLKRPNQSHSICTPMMAPDSVSIIVSLSICGMSAALRIVSL